jgi:hypothetical protein
MNCHTRIYRGRTLTVHPLGLRSRYSDWLRARWPTGRSSSPGRVKNFLFSTSSRPAVGSTIQGLPGAISRGVKLTTHLQLVPRSRKCSYIHLPPPTSLHGIVLNYLSTSITLPFLTIVPKIRTWTWLTCAETCPRQKAACAGNSAVLTGSWYYCTYSDLHYRAHLSVNKSV